MTKKNCTCIDACTPNGCICTNLKFGHINAQESFQQLPEFAKAQSDIEALDNN